MTIRNEGGMLSLAMAEDASDPMLATAVPELRAAADPVPVLPLVLQLEQSRPESGESWSQFKARVADLLGTQADHLRSRAGATDMTFLFAGSALAVSLTPQQVEVVRADPGIFIEFAELDPLLPVVAMDAVVQDIGLPAFHVASGNLDGTGVKVAVLDSGIDGSHPALTVAADVETCGEPVSIPGSHGTHCGGILASRDTVLPGVAPGVDLINVKVLRSNGTGRHTAITKGIDEALDLEVDILSMSLGFNHLPVTLQGGHGWTCLHGTCPLCLAVDNAVAEGALVVVAAGNEHERCQQARLGGFGLLYDTELGCPGQARRALTVGSHNKVTHAPAASSSSGPSSFGEPKPDVAAPGVNVLSTIPIPRDAAGTPLPGSARALQFGTKSGTSMATPVVAGACALLIQRARQQAAPDDPNTIRATLLGTFVEKVGGPPNVLGAGRLRLA